MTRKVPWGQYESKTAAAVAFRGEGLTPQEIGEKMGEATATIRSLLYASDAAHERRVSWQANALGVYTVEVPGPLVIRLKAEARRRERDPRELAMGILQVVVQDNLIDAVIDGDDPAEDKP